MELPDDLQIDLQENAAIIISLTYHIVAKIQYVFEERIFKEGSRRYYGYNLALSGGRILINEGWRETWKQIRKKISYDPDLWKKGVISINNPLVNRNQDTKKINESYVSIVIPTKNAGSEFQAVLETIKSQKGVKGTEIIILDSGSSDSTVDIAKKYQCRIFPVEPECFHHGLTRNFGADQATGDFVLFMVQDAIPLGNDWLCGILETFWRYPEIVAVTCRQMPRSDADLFASYIIWNHYRQMELYDDRIARVDRHFFNELSFSDRRKLAGIDDVCTCFKKEVFCQLKFGTLEFAEDLDLGIRLLENGFSLAFLYSVAVIHSHNRDAEYFFQRNYVDSKTLNEMNSESPVLKEFDINKVLQSMDLMYTMLHQFILVINEEYPENIRVSLFFEELKKHLYYAKKTNNPLKPETNLENLLSYLMTYSKPATVDSRLFIRDFCNLLDGFSSYAETIGKIQRSRELSECANKLFGMYYGSYLGRMFSHRANKTEMQSIDTFLKRGI
jgi:glycosyltransferase involved in cell wall biosynthesis